MPLESKHFRNNDRLKQCLVKDSAHVRLGARGEHVALIHQALLKIVRADIPDSEIGQEYYGPGTVAAVRKYKGPPRNIINTAYQTSPDGVVGRMTIERLDLEMSEIEMIPDYRPVVQKSLLVAQTPQGAPHDHSKCPPLQAGEHEGTPINPIGSGRMINFYGVHETDYLGFQDYAVDPMYVTDSDKRVRPVSWRKYDYRFVHPNSASDICMRAIPIYSREELDAEGRWYIPSMADEIMRIGRVGCRITFCGEEKFARKLFHLGPLVEKTTIVTPNMSLDGKTVLLWQTSYAWVISLLHRRNDGVRGRRAFSWENVGG